MINNRQGGRRRGRGGGPRSPNAPPNIGNRQDNRARGNAAQLLEKYKSLARDAQMAGDRVQAEYYHQFADHYHRVLSETRSRYEEQRRQRDDYSSDDEDDQDESGAEAADQDEGEAREAEQPQRNGDGRPRRQQRGRRRDQETAGEEGEGEERIALESLPPAIAAAEEAKPRRRTRRPRGEGETEIAPAA